MASFDLDHDAAVLARRQHGVLSWIQAQRLGFTSRMVSTRLGSRAWVRLAPGVYALRTSEGTFLRQCWAAVLATPGAVVGGLAAAAVLGLTDFRPCHPELVVPRTTRHRNALAAVHRYDGACTTEVRRLPVTTVAQTLCDIAPRVSVLKLERALDDHLLSQRGPPDLSPFEERVAFYQRSRRPGIATLAALVTERQPGGWQPPASELERRLWRLLRRLTGRPRLVRQAPFPWRDAIDGRFDILIPDWRTIVEGDSRRWHARVRDFDRDRWRDNEAIAHGLRPLRFTWAHITQRPKEVLDLVGRTGALAA
jgi:very-short-patch-repair endonuclease